jgi:DNA polymerase-3 subunit chi
VRLGFIEFHTGLADPLGYACRLLRKAHRQGLRVLVTAPAATLVHLDRELWTFEEREFVPHQRWPAGSGLPHPDAGRIARTPIWLAASAQVPAACTVLVNLGADVPGEAMDFERVVELVSHEADDAAAGRERWRRWKALGLEPRHRNAAAAS